MANYSVKTRQDVVTTNTTFNDTQYGGWMAVNTGTVDIKVDGYTLEPGMGVDYTWLQPNVVYESPIRIIVPTGGECRLTRFLYKEV